MSTNTCETDFPAYIMNTLGLGLSCALSAYSAITAIYFTFRGPSTRKFLIIAASFALLITSIIFACFLLDGNHSILHPVLATSFLFLRVSLALQSSAGILRYTIFLAKKKRMTANYVLCGSTAIIIMYIFAADTMGIKPNTSQSLQQSATFAYSNEIQASIPTLHIFLGLFHIYQSSNQKFGVTAQFQKFVRINMGFSALIIITWMGYLVLPFFKSESVGLGVALLTLLVYFENHLSALTEAVWKAHQDQ